MFAQLSNFFRIEAKTMGEHIDHNKPVWLARAQIGKKQSALLIFPTPFCQNRYQKLAVLAERCNYFCGFSASNTQKRVKYSILSVLHKASTAFAYRIRASPSEV